MKIGKNETKKIILRNMTTTTTTVTQFMKKNNELLIFKYCFQFPLISIRYQKREKN